MEKRMVISGMQLLLIAVIGKIGPFFNNGLLYVYTDRLVITVNMTPRRDNEAVSCRACVVHARVDRGEWRGAGRSSLPHLQPQHACLSSHFRVS